MTTKIQLSLACGDYEIMRALKEGTVRPDGIDLKVLTAMDSPTRHWRFLRNGDFDMAEVSCSSYIAARDRGLPFRALPVFPHRRFRHGFAYINTSKGIKKPTDLIGKKVGVKFFPHQRRRSGCAASSSTNTACRSKSIKWFTELDEDVEPSALPPESEHHARTGLQVDRQNAGRRRARRGVASRPDQADTRERSRGSVGCFPITRPRRWPITRRPACFRSCTR